jgi:hypothetical protein
MNSVRLPVGEPLLGDCHCQDKAAGADLARSVRLALMRTPMAILISTVA